MKRPTWKDVSSYSRDSSERVPTTWELKLTRDVRIVVTRGHIHEKQNWVMHCRPWFDTYSLKLPSIVENKDEAQAKALTLVSARVAELAAAIARATEGV